MSTRRDDVVDLLHAGTNRRGFLRLSSLTVAGFAITGIACDDGRTDLTEPIVPPDTTTANPPNRLTTANFGTGDVAVLNYAYALEQLEALFYSQVVANPYSGISSAELLLLTDIRNHEIAHRDFLRTALAGNAIPGLNFDFSGVNFNSRDSVLTTARTFEDLGVSAYNGAGRLLTNPDFLVVAGKIVSVEARHAAAIRDTLQPRTTHFAATLDANGLDVVRTPAEVLAAADPFIDNTLITTGIPSA